MRTKHCLVWITLWMVLAAGCARESKPVPEERPEAAAKAQEAGNGLITVTVMTNGDRWFDSMVAAYQERRPDRRVKIIKRDPSDATGERRKAKLRAGEVDVFTLWYPDLTQGLTLALDPYIQKTGLDLKPYGPFVDQLRYDGKLHALPTVIWPDAVLYSKRMLAEAKLPEPGVTWTWEEFRQYAAALTRAGSEPPVAGFYTMSAEGLLIAWVESKTGRPWWEAEADVLREGLDLLATLTFTDRSMPPAQKVDWSGNVHFEETHNFWAKNVAMMAVSGSQMSLTLNRTADPLGILPFPVHPGGEPRVYVDPLLVGISAGTRQPDAAWDFLQFLAGPEGASVSAGLLSLHAYATPEAEQAWIAASAPPGSEWMWRGRRVYPPQFGTPAFRLGFSLTKMVNRTLSGELSPEAALADYLQVAQKVRESN